MVRKTVSAVLPVVLLAALSACATAPASAPAPARGQAAAAPAPASLPRVVALEGGSNFRDLGGYATGEGGHVREGMIYRSAAMSRFTPADFATVRRLGIHAVYDLRSTEERAREPVSWPQDMAMTVLSDEYRLNLDTLTTPLRQPGVDAARARAAMTAFYREIPFTYAGAYRRLFAQLLAGNAPLVFNCSAGKDRTGVAAALLLTALGVPRETVIADFLQSSRHFRYQSDREEPAQAKFWEAMPPGVLDAVAGVDRAYLEAAFDAIERRPGGLDAYYARELGLSPADMAALRARYVR